MWAPYPQSSLIGIYSVCQRGFKNISADSESRQLVVIGASMVNKCEFSVYTVRIFMKYRDVCTAKITF